MRVRAFLPLVGLMLCSAAPAAAQQQTVTSPRADKVNVTIYRDPNRNGGEINRGWLNGFALITETRTVALPAGESRVRFEGVAEGMVAVSAVVTGLPGGVVQKNRDAALLSPAALLDGSLGNRVMVRRVNPGSGKEEEQEAIIRSGPRGAVILQTDKGFESLRCSGLPETLVYDGVPEGLTAKPTLSVTTRSDNAVTATVTLTYLATGFDWAANYVATVNPDGKTLDLFAWLTVANSNGESFPDAQMMAVAGTLNKESDYRTLVTNQPEPELNLSCYPLGTGRNGIRPVNPPVVFDSPSSMAAPPAPGMRMMEYEKSVGMVRVSGSRIAKQEDLGDLKLYRVPMPVTIAANQQKQVALLVKDRVPFERVYETVIGPGDETGPEEVGLKLRMKNAVSRGLGVPLPSGGMAVFEAFGGVRLLAGRTTVTDYALEEEVEVFLSQSPLVQLQQAKGEKGRVTATLTNANPFPVNVEVGIAAEKDGQLRRASAKLRRKDGIPTWFATVPANGKSVLTYRLKD